MAFLKHTAVTPLKFEISESGNPSGEIVFRVSGYLNGQRIRNNLPSREEAQTELSNARLSNSPFFKAKLAGPSPPPD